MGRRRKYNNLYAKTESTGHQRPVESTDQDKRDIATYREKIAELIRKQGGADKAAKIIEEWLKRKH